MIKNIDERIIVEGFHTGHEVDVVTIQKSDYEQLKEQAERVQELENHIDHLYDNNVHLKGDYRLQEQNKRYREALEEILTLEKYNETDNFWDNDDDFYMYIQNTAKKALEGEE